MMWMELRAIVQSANARPGPPSRLSEQTSGDFPSLQITLNSREYRLLSRYATWVFQTLFYLLSRCSAFLANSIYMTPLLSGDITCE